MREIDRLLDVMRRLRDPISGCPWDQQQTFTSLVPFTIEETYEVAETIEQGQWLELPGELGDLLFQIVFYAQIGKEQGKFDFEQVAGTIADKLIRRHPHVFADATIEDAAAQTQAWEQHKQQERQDKAQAQGRAASALDGVSTSLPAMTRAIKLQRRAARVGFDWPDHHGVLDKLAEESQEVAAAWAQPTAREEELGDLLFTVVNLIRHAGADPEGLLRQANRKFERRFRQVEESFNTQGMSLQEASVERMEQAWSAVKESEQ